MQAHHEAMKLGDDFDEFVRDSSGRLLRTSYLLVQDRSAAEDLLQETLLRTARRWRVARKSPEAYARRVLVNLTRDRWRLLRRRPVESLDAHVASVESDPTEEWAERQDIVSSFRLLPDQQRAVAVLRLWEQMTVPETAELLGISEGTVKSYTARAVAHLRASLSMPVEGS